MLVSVCQLKSGIKSDSVRQNISFRLVGTISKTYQQVRHPLNRNSASSRGLIHKFLQGVSNGLSDSKTHPTFMPPKHGLRPPWRRHIPICRSLKAGTKYNRLQIIPDYTRLYLNIPFYPDYTPLYLYCTPFFGKSFLYSEFLMLCQTLYVLTINQL